MLGDMDRRQARAKGFLRGLADTLWPPRSLVSGPRGIGKGPLAPEEFGQIHFLTGPCATPAAPRLDSTLAPGPYVHPASPARRAGTGPAPPWSMTPPHAARCWT